MIENKKKFVLENIPSWESGMKILQQKKEIFKGIQWLKTKFYVKIIH